MDIKVNEYWSNHYKNMKSNVRDNWWQSPEIIRHVNKTICGEALDGWNAGPMKLLKQVLPENYRLKRALSVGCGVGNKEIMLLENDIVEEFICFDLSEEGIKRARKNAEEKGMSDRILFLNEDFFTSCYANEVFDMVFWDNSLHHMTDTTFAVQKSYDILQEGGIFFLNDFVGKNRFQWSDMEMIIVNGIRSFLSEDLFVLNDGNKLRRFISRPSLEYMIAADPSEAADSEAILPAIRKIFKEPFIVPTGGIVYHVAIQFILNNISEDSDLLAYLLQLDDQVIKMGMTCYAFALAVK